MGYPIFKITDGTTAGAVDFVGGPLYIKSWAPLIPGYKDGGVYIDSPLSPGRRLAFYTKENVIERVDFAQKRNLPEDADRDLAKLVRLLDRAAQHWTTNGRKPPVWLEVKSAKHSSSKYAKIISGQLSGLANRFSSPYLQQGDCGVVEPELVVLIERKDFTSVPPGQTEALPLTGNEQVTQLLHDPSFEEGTSRYDYWYKRNSNYTIQFVTTPVLHGRYAVLLEATVSATGGLIHPVYGLDPGSTVTVTVYARALTGTAKLTAYDGGGTFTSAVSDTTTSSAWTLLTVNKTVPASGQVDVAIELGNTGDQAYFDYAQMLQVTGTPSTESTDKIYLVNSRNEQPLNMMFIDDGGAFGSNLIYDTAPIDLLPASPAVNDAIYFGTIGILGGSPFNNILFNLSVAADVTLTWEYLNQAGSWAALGVIDNTESFSQTGINAVSFNPPDDWDRFGNEPGPGSALGTFIRAKVTAVGSAGTATQQTWAPFIVLDNFIEIPATNLTGDSPPSVDLSITNETSSAQPKQTIYLTAGTDDGVWDVSFPPADVTSAGGSFQQDNTIIVRYSSVDIPKGAKIKSAKIRAISNGGSNNGAVNYRIYLQEADDAASFINTTDVPARTYLSDFVEWALPGDEWVDNNGKSFPTPDLATLIQQIVDRDGWAAGNAMLFMFADWVSVLTSTRNVDMYDGDTEAWALDIEYVDRQTYVSDILIGARSVSRGDAFHAVLNIGPETRDSIVWSYGEHSSFDLYTGVIDGPLHASQHLVASTTLPSGSPTGDFADRFIAVIPPVLSTSYTGKFRAFLRVYNATEPTAGEEPVSRLRLAVSGDSYYTQSAKLATTARYPQLLDMGVVHFPDVEPGEDASEITIAVQTKFVSTGTTLYYLDVVLIPADEWIAELVSPRGGAGVLTAGRTLDVRSIDTPSNRLASKMINDNGQYVRWRAGGQLLRPPLDETTRLWFLAVSEESVDGLGISSTNVSFQGVVMSVQARYVKAYALYDGVL